MVACYILTLGGVTPGPGPGQVQEQRQSVAVGDRVELDCRVTGRYSNQFFISFSFWFIVPKKVNVTPHKVFFLNFGEMFPKIFMMLTLNVKLF